jgi:hypothetical protein
MKKRGIDNPTLVFDKKNVFGRRQEKISQIRKSGIAAGGRSELIEHLQGHRLYASKAIRAFCYDCMGWYADGKNDCHQDDCPLYPFMPYRTPSGDAISIAARKKQRGGGVIVPSFSQIAKTEGVV